MSAPRQINLDGTYTVPACKHRPRTRLQQLLRSGRIGMVETCRCGAARERTQRTDGQFETTDWSTSPS